MVDVLGHFAMGLLWAAPAWLIWDRRVAATFVALVVPAAQLPDVDLYLPGVVHHGPTHTVFFVVAVGLLAGAVVLAAFSSPLRRWLRPATDDPRTVERRYVFVAAAFITGGLSHVFADVLSAPDLAQPLEPFWPLLKEPVVVDVIYFSAPAWNSGLLALALLAHAGLFLATRVTPTRSIQVGRE